MPAPDPPTDITVVCYNLPDASDCVRVWKAMSKLKANHFAGPTVQEIKEDTGLPEEQINRALVKLGSNTTETGCLTLKYCQEGTAGPYAARFAPKKDVKPIFSIKIQLDESYGVKLQ